MNENGNGKQSATIKELEYWDSHIEFLAASIDILIMEKERAIIQRAKKIPPTQEDFLRMEAITFPNRDFVASEMMRSIALAASQIISKSGEYGTKVTFEECLKKVFFDRQDDTSGSVNEG